MTSWTGVAVAGAASFVLMADPASACSCVASGPPCQAAWSADVVFTGTVKSIEPIEDTDRPPAFRSVRVTFSVEQGFIGAISPVVEVTTGAGGGDCGYRFVAGRRYIVYANRQETGGLVTGTCNRTRPIEDAGEDVRYLTSNPAAAGGRFYGRITERRRDPAEERSVDYGPLEGIEVSVIGPTWQKSAATDPSGRFEITGLPVGKASYFVSVPFGFDQRFRTGDLEIKDPRGCVAQDFMLTPRATASGRVVDASGHPVAGVAVDAVALELAGFEPPPYQMPVRTDEQGNFRFDALPPGSYVFGVNLTKDGGRRPRPGPAVFLPGVSTPSSATVVELKAGDEAVVGVLRLPAR
jgi:hypothetical protein